ncbi:hypothetical protein Tco_1139540 [Tanacetum coccineum]
MSKKVEVIELSDSSDALSGGGIEKGIEGSSKASIPPFGSAKRPRPELSGNHVHDSVSQFNYAHKPMDRYHCLDQHQQLFRLDLGMVTSECTILSKQIPSSLL